MTPLRHGWHLVTRFFGVITHHRLGPLEQDEIAGLLSPAEADLFWRQQPIDQRHSYDVAQRVKATVGPNREAMVAALLHDVGKKRSNLGPIGRSLATVAYSLRLPLPMRWRMYREHGRLGATELERVGASSLAVNFARGARGIGDDPALWQALVDADNA